MIGKNNPWNRLFLSSVQLLILILVTGKGSALTSNSSGTPGKTTVFNRLPLNGVLFTEDVLLEVFVGNQIDCSRKCVETEGCVMCTFLSSPQGPPGHCQLHSQLQNLTDAWKNKTGAESFERVLCGEGYVVSCGRCVKAGGKSLNYTAAQQQCHAMDQGRLVMPKTSAGLSCVFAFLKPNGPSSIWVGADDIKEPDVFNWNDGILLPDNSSLWAEEISVKSNPGNACVFVVYIKAALYHTPCNATFHYVCQKDFM